MSRDRTGRLAPEPPYYLFPTSTRTLGLSNGTTPAGPFSLGGDERPGQAPDINEPPTDTMPTVTSERSTVELLMDLHVRTAEAISRIDQELGSLG